MPGRRIVNAIDQAATNCTRSPAFNIEGSLRVGSNSFTGVRPTIRQPPGVSHGMPLHVNFYATAYAAGAVAMTVTLVAASWFPARSASRISIIEALAHV
jgi:ABC-type lipoprotein release transport system permease subunit